jgi:hypothetical protein
MTLFFIVTNRKVFFMMKFTQSFKRKLGFFSTTSFAILSALLSVPEAYAMDEMDEIEKKNPHLVRLADQGDPDAQYALGMMYRGKNDELTIKYFKPAADQGHTEAQFNLAYLYALYAKDEPEPKGCKYSQDTIYYYELAANKGHLDSQCYLAGLHYAGELVQQNDKEAYRWYSAAAEQNFKGAQFALAMMYEDGRGVAQDFKKAFHYYSLAVDHMPQIIHYRLGTMYDNGKGVMRDEKLAFKHFQLAADYGYSRALKEVDRLMKKARGVVN